MFAKGEVTKQELNFCKSCLSDLTVPPEAQGLCESDT